MKRFLTKHENKIAGVLSGFDRLIFRGGIRGLLYEGGLAAYLNYKNILLKDFKVHAQSLTSELREKTEQYAASKERPYIYLQGHGKSKEKMAREIAIRDNITEGLVCIFSVLENCGSYNEFKTYRPVGETDEMKWQPMRKSVVDIYRRAEISQSVNERHLDALADAKVDEKFSNFLSAFLFPIYKDRKRTRGLEPLNKDKLLLDAIGDGKFLINGFRNCNIRKILFPNLKTKEEIKKHSAKISRLFRILRTHGLIKKVPRTNRYLLTKKGTKIISALKSINESKVCDLLKLSA